VRAHPWSVVALATMLVVALALPSTLALPAAWAAARPGSDVEPSTSSGSTTEPGPTADQATVRAWSQGAVVAYDLPVEAELTRPFEAPAHAFGPGHRGIDLAALPGATVRAAADGVVRHAGPVAGVVWVSIEHPDGIVTSYGPLDGVAVAAGERVARGQPLGKVADGQHDATGAQTLHFGARRDGAYFDPTGLFAPLRPALVGPGGWRGSAHVVVPYERWRSARWGDLALASSPTATAPGYAVPPSGNHLVLLNGVGTDGGAMPIDPTHLGYDPSSVTAFSYAGRHEGPGDLDDPWRDQRPYRPEHTWPGVPEAARRLEAQLRAQYAREPGRAVDLAGHSMGGIVAMYYLTHLHDPYDPGLPPIGKVVTIASPLAGSDLADTGRWLRSHDGLRPLLELAMRLPPGRPQRELTPLDMPALDQLATGSALLDALADDFGDAVAAGGAGPLAMGTRVVSVGGSRDLVATPGRTSLQVDGVVPGGVDEVVTRVVLPGGHDGVKHTEAARQVVWEALRGRALEYPSQTLTSTVTDDAGGLLRVLGRLANVLGMSSARPPGRADVPNPP
jgi:murein DD-endopeptidase MepM/ murein hydrolase activator NlpD